MSNAAQTAISTILTDRANQISSVFLNNTNYPVKDADGRTAIRTLAVSVDLHTDEIADLYRILQGGVYYVGKTTSPLYDGATTNPIIIDGQPVPIEKAGAITIYQPSGKEAEEFIWDGEKWNALGSTNGLGDLAFSDQTSAAYTPSGSVSLTATNDVTATITATFSPGTVSPDAQVNIPAQTVNTTLSASAATITSQFTGKAATLQTTFTGTSADLTPAGTISQVVTNVNPGSANTGSSQYGNETLSIFFSTALTSVGETKAAPTFTGTYKSYTPAGSVGDISYTPEATNVTASYTPVGNVKVEIPAQNNVSVYVEDITTDGSVSGTVKIPGHTHSAGFSGTPTTITANPIPIPTP